MKRPFTFAGTTLLASCTLFALLTTPANLRAGYALSFNGVNQYVAVNVPPLARNYTVCAWVYLLGGGDVYFHRVGVLTASTCGNTTELLVRSQTGSAGDPQYLELGRCDFFNGGQSTAVVPLNQWVHLAATVDVNNQVSYFIDGAPAGGWDASAFDATLGGDITLAGADVRTFNGDLGGVQIWSRALSQTEIQAGMNQAPNLADTNLWAYWPFAEGAGTQTTADASGHGHAGTLVNSPAWVAGVPDIFTFADGGVITNTFGFNMSSLFSQTAVVEACTNLAAPVWVPVQTNTLDSTPVWFSDPLPASAPARFYRLRNQPND
jgi:hypothetical protein